MAVALQEGSRPPFIKFYQDSVEDRAATEATGKYTALSVNMVEVRQAGSKDSVQKNAEDWLKSLQHNPTIRPEWVGMFHDAYERWKKGQDPVAHGTAIKDWPSISRAQVDMILSAQIPTVEDLAAANEMALARIGIGGRELQQKARAWLESADSFGKGGEELVALRTKNAALEARIQALEQALRQPSVAPIPTAPPVTDPFE